MQYQAEMLVQALRKAEFQAQELVRLIPELQPQMETHSYLLLLEVQKVLRQAVKECEKSAEEKEQILHTIETVVPMIVQAAILASKHPIAGQVQAACVGCWTKVKKS